MEKVVLNNNIIIPHNMMCRWQKKTHVCHSERRYTHIFDVGGTYYFFFVVRMGLNAAHFT